MSVWLVVSNIFYLALGPTPCQLESCASRVLGGIRPRCLWCAMVWGDPGLAKSWVFPVDASIGVRQDIVADVVSFSGEGALVALVPCGTKAKVFGVTVPHDCCCITVLEAKLLDKVPFLVFEAQDPSDVLYHKRGNRDDLYNIVELCCGIGIGAMGSVKQA